MYLSRIRASGPAVLGVLGRGAYEQHRLLWRLFSEPQGQPRDFLFRRAEDEPGMTFYVLSARQPMDQDGIWLMQTKPFAPRLSAGDHLAFSLRANPVRSRRVPRLGAEGEDSYQVKRDNVVMRAKKELEGADVAPGERPSEAQLVQTAGADWLLYRADRCGFSLDPELVRVDGYRQHVFQRDKDKVRFSTLDFEGRLTVTDPEVFVASLARGIGPAKAFGCGLMLIRRA